ncbi:alpha/beta hydrolase [Membranihabitans marinus]|uniref:alpha/beta hydrolase n=1 Tax=Membranihabitans marinus TaxID=1227546 RepID=UPI001F40012B|nr:acetylxylan esterase [Membranihabitans marinus]
MKSILFFLILFIAHFGNPIFGQEKIPNVYQEEGLDFVASTLNHKALLAYYNHPVPSYKADWESYKSLLRSRVEEKTGLKRYPDLPLDYHETQSHSINGITVKNIYFQTRPGVYATANLYIPSGEGPFPAVITMMGHGSNAKLYDLYQSIGQTLAVNGYVSLNIDPWGSGERATVDGQHEYHGSNLGASLFNIGESLMGMQLTDNIRGVDLLTSLSFVDKTKIAATGSSGGGNQTMWLTAMDERIQVGMPVVSVGTFQSYIMSSNCVCETLIDGLTYTEESSVLGMVAPRVLKICSAAKESNKAFFPEEMKRSYNNALPVFEFYGSGHHLTNQIFETTHGYHPEMREALLGLLDFHFKGIGDGMPRPEKPFELLEAADLKVFIDGQRPSKIVTTMAYCQQRGRDLKNEIRGSKSIDLEEKKSLLSGLLKQDRVTEKPVVFQLSKELGWERYSFQVKDGTLIPVLIKRNSHDSGKYLIIGRPKGKSVVENKIIDDALRDGYHVCLIDFYGSGEAASPAEATLNGSYLPDFHTTARAELWLGSSISGIWTQQLNHVIDWLKIEQKAKTIDVDMSKELGPVALFYSALYDPLNSITLRDAPVSYVFDTRENIDYYSMALPIPKILQWGDLSLVAAMSQSNIYFENPRTASGNLITPSDWKLFEAEYRDFKKTLQVKNGSIDKK